jgi:hypothetical protein
MEIGDIVEFSGYILGAYFIGYSMSFLWYVFRKIMGFV